MKYLFVIIFFFIVSCDGFKSKNSTSDTPEYGVIKISVDESFKPVIEDQLKVYKSSNPNTNIIVSYKSEVDCFNDLLNDSTRLIIVSRGLTKKEIEYFRATLSFKPQFDIVAYDGVAAIVNKNSTDSTFTLNDLKEILAGQKNITVILDGTNATSTVKYLQDSILMGAEFGKNVKAVNGSNSVISTIKQNTNAIGFIGNSWVNNIFDEVQLRNFDKIRLALIECKKCGESGYFAKASQATLTNGQYPLARPLYYIVKENRLGLGTGFANFLSLERGQLIFRRSSLVPANLNFNKRVSRLKEK